MILDQKQSQIAPCRRCSVGGKLAQLGAGFGDGCQFKRKGRALFQATTKSSEPTAVSFGDRFANGQPEPQTRAALLARRLDLEERVEDVPQWPRINPDAGVANFDGQMISLVATRFDGDPSSPRCEFNGVLDEIPKDLLQPAGIAFNEMPCGGGFERELKSFTVNLRLTNSNRLLETQMDIDPNATQLELAAGYACDIE